MARCSTGRLRLASGHSRCGSEMGRSRSALATECTHSATELIATPEDVATEIALRRSAPHGRSLRERRIRQAHVAHAPRPSCGDVHGEDEHPRASPAGKPRARDRQSVVQSSSNSPTNFPHHFGCGESSLARTVESAGFARQSMTSVPAIRPLRDRLTKDARDEEQGVEPAGIEAVFRRE